MERNVNPFVHASMLADAATELDKALAERTEARAEALRAQERVRELTEQTSILNAQNRRVQNNFTAAVERAEAAEARVRELEEKLAASEERVRTLRNALARQEDICSRSHWSAEGKVLR